MKIFRSNILFWFLISGIAAFFISSCGCGHNKGKHIDLDGMHVELPDTLLVGMLNSPTTYFDYRGTPMGYDYELMSKFSKFYGVQFKVVTGGTISEMIEWLDNGNIDILASPVPVTAEFQDRALLCGPRNISCQVLV
ncbi:MAG: transporter substrate-binding domain-containing protein, partial [Muribaculaceae bacterium]|nr:transporter substrate-binding domain-containing protein [Muribaculaceae bacterium]